MRAIRNRAKWSISSTSWSSPASISSSPLAFGFGVIVYSVAKNWVSLTKGPSTLGS